jgi:hypothetical protein
MTNTETTTKAPIELAEQLRAAGTGNSLTSKVLERIATERAKATAKAARLCYRSDDEPITALQFADELDTMVRRLWGLVAAVGDLVEDHDDPLSRGVIQLVEDATKEMERLVRRGTLARRAVMTDLPTRPFLGFGCASGASVLRFGRCAARCGS